MITPERIFCSVNLEQQFRTSTNCRVVPRIFPIAGSDGSFPMEWGAPDRKDWLESKGDLATI